jgi:hypothetical protein
VWPAGEGAAPCFWASGRLPTMPPLFPNVCGNEMALGEDGSGGRLSLGSPAASWGYSMGRKSLRELGGSHSGLPWHLPRPS